MTDQPYPSGRELRDTIRDLLPHPSFSISFRRLDNRIVIVVHCECGRKLDMLDSLPGDILLYWLADHNDDMFLTDDQLHAKYEAKMEKGDPRTVIDAARLGLPVFARDIAPSPYTQAADSAWDALNHDTKGTP